MTTDTQGRAQVAGDGADVGAAGAADAEVDVDHVVAEAYVVHDELVDGDAARGELDLLAGPHPRRRRAGRRP